MLKNKNILIGVTGSIAIYKTLELIRLFIKANANVRVILTQSAKKFITPLTFETLSKNIVLDEITESWANDNNHIDIGKWADIFIIAPISANTINKIACGISDNLLTQTVLAYNNTILLAPAANTNMITNQLTQANIKKLKMFNFKIVEPIVKNLACGDTGIGAMADVKDIFYEAIKELFKQDFWENRKVVISGGATIERIDDVRYISNFSSGKMANALAKVLYFYGADVCYIRGSVKDYDIPSMIHVIDVESVQEMDEYISDCIKVAKKGVLVKPTIINNLTTPKLIQKKPFYFGVAAISDYRVKYIQSGKLKKQDLGFEWDLKLTKTKDILASIDNDVYKIGFKAEYDESKAVEYAKKTIEDKKLDMICLNLISQHYFGSDTNTIELITKTNSIKFDNLDKLTLSFKMIDYITKYYME